MARAKSSKLSKKHRFECSFCGAGQSEAVVIVVGRGCGICDACVAVVTMVVAEWKATSHHVVDFPGRLQ